MSDCVDDRAPLLQPFVRGSSLRTAVRWPRTIHDCSHTALHIPDIKPPLPPRPLLRRSLSATDRGESKDAQIPYVTRVGPQTLGGNSAMDEWRASSATPPLHRRHITSGAGYGASLHEREIHSVPRGGGEGNNQRYSFQFASMPRIKWTPPASPDLRWKGISTFRRGPPSPFSGRKTTQTEERASPRKEKSYDSKPSTFSENSFLRRLCRRSQTPPPPPSPSPLRSPVTYKRDVTTNPHSPNPFRRHNSVPIKKSTDYVTNPIINESSVKSSSFRHARPDRRRYSGLTSHLPALSSTNTHHTEKYPLSHSDSQRYFTPDDRHSDRWRVETPPVHRKNLSDIHTDRQRAVPPERRDSWRFSYPRRPMTTYLGSDAEPTQAYMSTSFGGDITTTTTTPSTTVPSSSSLAFHSPSRSLDVNDRSPPPGSWDKNHSVVYSDDNSSSPQHKEVSSPSMNLSRVSSDSGYSTCSNTSGVSRTNSVISDGDGDMIAWFGSRLNLKEEESLAKKSPTDHFSYLIEKEKEYLMCLDSMLRDYRDMISKTPSLIRQHFDLIFKQVEVIYAFQVELQTNLWKTRGQLDHLARVFTNEHFQCYGRYMVMMPAVQRDLMQYSSHFKEHFPDLKRNILKPSLRINFYAMILDSFKKEATEDVKDELQDAIDYLNQVKRKANTEMTLNTVIHSPVDLRLGGDMLYIGELNYIGGGSLQKKKYQVILFENLLVITSMKIPYFKYKTHYRVEQLESVMASGENELFLNVLSEGQTQLTTLKFKIKSPRIRDEWVNELQKITRRNTKLTQGRGSVNLRQIPRQRFRTLPLDLFRVFPLLKDALIGDVPDGGKTDSLDEYSLSNMICYEERYVKNLSLLLNPESPRPPEPLGDLLETLYRLHTRRFLPALQRSQKISDFVDFLAENENLDDLSIYSDYLVIRSQLTVKLDNAPQASPYIRPVQHVYGIYLGLMKELSTLEKYKKSTQRVIKSLREDIRVAQVRVLKEAIVNGRLDFQRSGDLILYSPLELKTRKKEIRAGEYIVLLFENVIILTKPKLPYYEYVMDIWLDQVNLGPPASHDCTFRVEVRQGGRKEPITYEMCASTVELKQEWHRRLHQQMLIQVEKIRERIAAVGETSGGVCR